MKRTPMDSNSSYIQVKELTTSCMKFFMTIKERYQGEQRIMTILAITSRIHKQNIAKCATTRLHINYLDR